jgi:hypothetical protein
VKPMYEAIVEKFSALATLVMTDGSTIMIAEGVNIIHFSAIALILVFLAARIAKKKDGSFFKWPAAGRTVANDGTSGRIFKRQHIQALKKCPKCAEQLQLSALICDTCDYNFLSGMVGQRDRLLPSPEPLAHEVSKQTFAYRA